MISPVIPAFNEEELIHQLFARVRASLLMIASDFEVIPVDDGSTDRTLERLEARHLEAARYKGRAPGVYTRFTRKQRTIRYFFQKELLIKHHLLLHA
jgi:glycosyltransferase involved in cell wall biosynthesis